MHWVNHNDIFKCFDNISNSFNHSEIIAKHKDKRIILLTAHRRENIGEPMVHIFKAVRDIVEAFASNGSTNSIRS
jgi:UDP-N-acetylglucosamine 2-epimerase (non-hydrolysing)